MTLMVIKRIKVKVTGNENPNGKQRYSSTPSLASALDGGWVANATSRRLYPRERDPVPIVREAGWAPGPAWTGGENITPPGFDPGIVQPVARRCTH